MVVRRRKKIAKKRGKLRARSGEIRRGAGNRGGRGKAGVGKKGTWHKRLLFIYITGKRGFRRLHPKLKKEEEKCINLDELEERLEEFVSKGFAKQEGDTIIVNLAQAGYDKLLGRGKVTKKLKVIVRKASEKAIEKIQSLGGEVKWV